MDLFEPVTPVKPITGGGGIVSWMITHPYMLMIAIVIVLILIGPWLFCTVMKQQAICDIISGLKSMISKVLSAVF